MTCDLTLILNIQESPFIINRYGKECRSKSSSSIPSYDHVIFHQISWILFSSMILVEPPGRCLPPRETSSLETILSKPSVFKWFQRTKDLMFIHSQWKTEWKTNGCPQHWHRPKKLARCHRHQQCNLSMDQYIKVTLSWVEIGSAGVELPPRRSCL